MNYVEGCDKECYLVASCQRSDDDVSAGRSRLSDVMAKWGMKRTLSCFFAQAYLITMTAYNVRKVDIGSSGPTSP